MDIQMMDGNPQENLPFKHCKSPKKLFSAGINVTASPPIQ
jgi:hypothetical protein